VPDLPRGSGPMTLEHTIEERSVKELLLIGCEAIKVGQQGWPDRLVPLGKEYPGAVIWIEFKATDGALRPAQKIRHRQLAALGQTVVICRSYKEALGEVAKARRAIDRTRKRG
jgi:hypothetical protein